MTGLEGSATQAAADPHLLTVLHAAERTGPPLFALQFLRWLREHHPEWRTSTLFLDAGGSLTDEFAELGPVVVAGDLAPYAPGGRATHRAHVRKQLRLLRAEVAQLGPIDVAHIHCAGSMRAYPALPSGPVLCHLHELDVGLDLHLGPLAREHLSAAERYLAVSDGVRDAFLARVAVDPARVERRWGFVDARRLPDAVERGDLGLDPQAFVVASSGVRHWRKAPELFVRTALAARRLAPEVPWHFVWVGGADAGGLEDLVAEAGLDDLVAFLPHQPDPLRWIAAADVFFLPAREDAFPLVCVEASALGRPIVTFDNGGAAELVAAADSGRVVSFPDVEAAARALAELAHADEERQALGERARAFAHEHLLLEQAGPALHAAIEATREVSW
ncbi:MAG: glycosyltransferase [Acidimicrobiales bacterium]|nr:glycosyltransferase [Acidimicrobiales bacterium]